LTAIGNSMQAREEVELHSVPGRDNIFLAVIGRPPPGRQDGPGTPPAACRGRHGAGAGTKKILLPSGHEMCYFIKVAVITATAQNLVP